MAFDTHPFESEGFCGVFQPTFEVFKFGNHGLCFEGVFYEEVETELALAELYVEVSA